MIRLSWRHCLGVPTRILGLSSDNFPVVRAPQIVARRLSSAKFGASFLIPSFESVGRKLISNNHYQGLIDAILDCEEGGFIMLDSPSGSGKTQAGVALSQLDHTRSGTLAASVDLSGNRVRVVHLVWPAAVNGQTIYKEILKKSMAEDLEPYRFFRACQQFAGHHFKKRFTLADSDMVWRTLLQPLFNKDLQQMKDLVNTKLVLFLDEFPSTPRDVQDLLVVREALRNAKNVILIIAGTSAKVSNAVSLEPGYSTSEVQVTPERWSLLVTRLPAFQLEYSPIVAKQMDAIDSHMEKDDDSDLKAIKHLVNTSISNGGNPRLIVFAVEELFKVLNIARGSRWTAWQRAFSNRVTKNKFAVDDIWYQVSGGLCSQLNLLCEGSTRSQLSDVTLGQHFAYRAVPDDGHNSSTSAGARLADCGGWLYIGEPRQRAFGRRLQFLAGPSTELYPVGGIHDWDTTVFAAFERDPLVYVGSCRQGGFFSVIGKDGQVRDMFRAHEVVLNLWGLNSAGLINFQNPHALCNTGGRLEIITSTACCNAAAVAEQGKLGLCEYFGNLMVQLGLPVQSHSVADILGEDDAFSNLFVPRCIFPGSDLPTELAGAVALITRLKTSEGFDFKLIGLEGTVPEISGEAKDRKEFRTDKLAKAIRKLSKRSAIAFIVVRGCNGYWLGDRNVGTNMESLKSTLNTPITKRNKDGSTSAERCQVGKILFFNSMGEFNQLDLENKGNGRIILIQVPASYAQAGDAAKEADAEADADVEDSD